MNMKKLVKKYKKEQPKIDELMAKHKELYPPGKQEIQKQAKENLKRKQWHEKYQEKINDVQKMIDHYSKMEHDGKTDTYEYKRLGKKIDDEEAKLGVMLLKQLKKTLAEDIGETTGEKKICF